MQNQSALWLNVRRDRPDWIYLQGFGAMNPTAVKEAVKASYPMDHFIGNWWAGGDDDARPAGAEAKGYISLDFNQVGQNFPVVQDILKNVVDKGKSQVSSKDRVGENFYNRGILNSVIIAEGIRNAQRITGKKVVTGEDVRRGLESLNITEARLKELGMDGFAAPFRVSCSDHNGHHSVYLAQWDGTKWTKASDWIEPIKDKVVPLIDAAAKEYATSNAGWPKRTEACDKSS
jgi:branched-chain amino acid transport system substrate-binding protein